VLGPSDVLDPLPALDPHFELVAASDPARLADGAGATQAPAVLLVDTLATDPLGAVAALVEHPALQALPWMLMLRDADLDLQVAAFEAGAADCIELATPLPLWRARIDACLRRHGSVPDATLPDSHRLHDELATMARLHALAARLQQQTDLLTALDDVLRETCDVSGADFGNVQLLDPASAELRIVVQQGLEPVFLEHFSRVGIADGSACGRALRQGCRVVIADVREDEEFAAHRELAEAAGIRGVQSTPLLCRRGELLGVLSTHYRAPYRPGAHELRMLDLFARHAAYAVERARSADALSDSEARYRTLFDSVDQGVCVIEMLFDGDRPVDYLFVEVNRMFESQTGLADVVGRRISELAPGHEAHWFEIYGRVARTGESIRFQQQASALERHYDVFAMRVGVPGQNRVAVLFNDITLRQRAENLLRESSRRKDEFLGTLAHELRNPLAPLRNGLELIRRAPGDTALIEKARAMMDRQLAHMIRLVDDLVDASRITLGKLDLRRQRIDLASAIRNAIETVRPLVDAAGQQLDVDMPEVPLIVDADLTRLSQVFANLLNNASKYTPPGGHLRLSMQSDDGSARVSVRDDGIGIRADMLERVFEMFAQADRSLENARGGLGIGLSLVQRLVGMHGGHVSARSDGPGRGSEFIVELPLAGAQADDGGSASPAALPVQRGRRVLVADDNREAAASLTDLLSLMGHDARVAHDGLEAMDLFARFRPDMVILDLGMPHMNGLETARRLRSQPGGKEVMLVALTGWGQLHDREQSRDAGFDLHLVKPIDMPALERLLSQRAA